MFLRRTWPHISVDPWSCLPTLPFRLDFFPNATVRAPYGQNHEKSLTSLKILGFFPTVTVLQKDLDAQGAQVVRGVVGPKGFKILDNPGAAVAGYGRFTVDLEDPRPGQRVPGFSVKSLNASFDTLATWVKFGTDCLDVRRIFLVA